MSPQPILSKIGQSSSEGDAWMEASWASLDWLNSTGARNECSLSMRICDCSLHSNFLQWLTHANSFLSHPYEMREISMDTPTSIIGSGLGIGFCWCHQGKCTPEKDQRSRWYPVASSVWKEFGNHTYDKLLVSPRKLRARTSYLVTGRNQDNF